MTTMAPVKVDFAKCSKEELKQFFVTANRVLKNMGTVPMIRYQTDNGVVTAPETVELYLKVNGKYSLLSDGEPVVSRKKNGATVVSVASEAVVADGEIEYTMVATEDEEDDEDSDEEDEDDEE